MEHQPTPYLRQIFVCTNQKEDNKPCCAVKDGEAIFRKLREAAKERGLHPKIRVAQAKCLGQCAQGTNIMIYPENVWLKAVGQNDIETVIDQYIHE